MMDDAGLRQLIFDTLVAIAPEVDPAQIAGERPLRDQVDLDSFDWLNFLLALHRQLQIDIPEADYRSLISVNAIVAYLRAKLAASGA